MDVIAEIIDNHNATVIVTDDNDEAQEFHIHSGAVYTYASLTETTDNITRHYFGFTTTLTLVPGPNGSCLIGSTR